MKPITAQQLSEILGVPLHAGEADALITSGVCTDTRALRVGAAYFALRGENFNGDVFATKALAEGARVAVVQEWSGENVPSGCAVICVKETLTALQNLAKWWRSQLHIPVIGITGSNGKTSTKDLTASVLNQRFAVSATRGNLNNHIGVPLTVLATTQEHQVAVWEMGMNHAGEIAPLCEIALPSHGIITNIGTAHIEFLGSREAIAEEKGMLGRALPSEGFLATPGNCNFLDHFSAHTPATVISVDVADADVCAENIVIGADDSQFTLFIKGLEPVQVILPIPGRHMITNALLAAAIGWKLGMDSQEIAKGLGDVQLTSGRLARYVSEGVTIIDDTYNANPESMVAAVETLATMPLVEKAGRFVVLGRMGELGMHGERAHLAIGALASERNLRVIAVGPGAEGIATGANNAPHFLDLADAVDWLKCEVKPSDVVLFKGSRSASVERVMHAAFPKR